MRILSSDMLPSRATSPEQAAVLMNQQLWCWGRDIECADGNLLVRFGFQRLDKPEGSDSASVYRLDLSPNARVVLRGFGVFFGDDRWGGMFVPRFDFKPQFTLEAGSERTCLVVGRFTSACVTRRDQLAEGQRLLLSLVDWIRSYEVWIAEVLGIDYRSESLVPWAKKHGEITPAEEMATAWRLLGVAVADNAGSFLLDREINHDC